MQNDRLNTDSDGGWLQRAVTIAFDNVSAGGRPFGAVMVRHDQLLLESANETHLSQDPTDHAELLLIRRVNQKLEGDFSDCVIYASGHPCPMCLGAMYQCGISRVVYAICNQEAETFGLSTAPIYKQIALPLDKQQMPICHLSQPEMIDLYRDWRILQDRK